MVASFDLLFGREEGEKVRQMCIAKGWALAWAHNQGVANLCTSVDGAAHAQTAPLFEGCAEGCWSVAGQCQFDPTTASPPAWDPNGGRQNSSCEGGGTCNSPRDAVAQRFLDPTVLTKVPEGHNSSADLGFAAAATDFAATWQSAHGVWSTPSLPFTRRTALLDKLWAKLAGQVARSGLAVEPLFGGACADEDACVAVRVADGKCVCAPAAGHAGA